MTHWLQAAAASLVLILAGFALGVCWAYGPVLAGKIATAKLTDIWHRVFPPGEIADYARRMPQPLEPAEAAGDAPGLSGPGAVPEPDPPLFDETRQRYGRLLAECPVDYHRPACDTPPDGFEVAVNGGRIRVGAHERGIQPRRSGVQPWDTAEFAPAPDPDAEEARTAYIRQQLDELARLPAAAVTPAHVQDVLDSLRAFPATTGARGGCTGTTGDLPELIA